MTEGEKAPKKAPSKAKKASKNESGFAVFATGGKQYLVQVGDRVKIEKLKGTFAEGDEVSFDSVIMTSSGSQIKLGSPFLDGGKISGTIRKVGRNKTIDVIKYKQKSRYFKKYGHRQPYFEVEITSI